MKLSELALFVLSVVATAFAVPTRARADVLPAADIQVAVESGKFILTAGTVRGAEAHSGPNGGSETSTATASFNGGVALASGSGSTSGGAATARSSGLAEVIFYFEVKGSAPGVTTVPLIFTANSSTSASGPGAQGRADLDTPGGQIYSCSSTVDSAGVCGAEPASNSSSLRYNAAPATLFIIQVTVSGYSASGTGSWSASVDPKVEIDPSFASARDFTLEFSPDVPGGSAPKTAP